MNIYHRFYCSLILFSTVGSWKLVSFARLAAKALPVVASGALFCNAGVMADSSITNYNFKVYSNSRFGASFQYPAAWEERTGTLSGDRSITAFVDSVHPETSVSIIYTPIPADFGSLGSFGGKDSIQSFLLPSGKGVETSLIQDRIKGNVYYLEYTVKAPTAPPRHIESIFALHPQETVVGVTIQTTESLFDSNHDTFQLIDQSFNLQTEH